MHGDKDPLHGLKLKDMVENLTSHYSWEELYQFMPFNCFKKDPSIKSTLKFIRTQDWARKQFEEVYLKKIILDKTDIGTNSPNTKPAIASDKRREDKQNQSNDPWGKSR